MLRFEPVRKQTFPYSQDVGSTKPSFYEGRGDNDIVYSEGSHPGSYHAISTPAFPYSELEATQSNCVPSTELYQMVPPPTATSEDSRVTLFYHGYTTDTNRHWTDEEALTSGYQSILHAGHNNGYTDHTPTALEATLPAGSPEKHTESKDPNLVTWTGPDDPLHPHNWSAQRRWTSTVLIAMFAFIAPMASTMLAPALHVIRKDLDVATDVEEFLLFSIFLLAFAMSVYLAIAHCFAVGYASD